MPNGSAQEAVMHKAYAEAGLDPNKTSYVEAHGTGTEVGDAIEAGAIASVFSKGRQSGKPVIVGSIKTNIGHTESTAGIAGLVKTILMLEKDKILPNYDFKKLSARIPIGDSHIKVCWLNSLPLNIVNLNQGARDSLTLATSGFASCISE